MEHNIVNECYGVNEYKPSVYHHGNPMQSNYQVIAMYRNFYVDDELSHPDIGKLFFYRIRKSLNNDREPSRCKPGNGTRFEITMPKGVWRMKGDCA